MLSTIFKCTSKVLDHEYCLNHISPGGGLILVFPLPPPLCPGTCPCGPVVFSNPTSTFPTPLVLVGPGGSRGVLGVLWGLTEGSAQRESDVMMMMMMMTMKVCLCCRCINLTGKVCFKTHGERFFICSDLLSFVDGREKLEIITNKLDTIQSIIHMNIKQCQISSS